MKQQYLSVREIKESDVALITNYWLTAEPALLTAMGVQLDKMPAPGEWPAMLAEQMQLPNEQKKSYCIIWELNGQPIGHCNVNKIIFGEEATMHLHIWYAAERKMGLGVSLIKLSLPLFFKTLQLKKVCCEPYDLNDAPNKTLPKAGFHFIKEHTTIPGSFSFEQPANLWEITADDLK